VSTKYNRDDHHRRSIRLRDYDYAQINAYFVTIVAQGRKCLFGETIEGEMRLNVAGRMVEAVWNSFPKHYPSVECDAFVVMPNHVHAVIVLGPRARPAPTGQPRGVAHTINASLALPDVVHRFKTLTTKQYIDGVKQNNWPSFVARLWQRNYFEHVIRNIGNEESLNRIRQYIVDNPAQWEFDRENPAATRPEPGLAWLV
jgi:REP-associated tyrosine transposase